jgi:putative ABC transport system permease protein
VLIAYHAVSADTFRTMGIKVLAGRGLTEADGWEAPRVAVVSRSLAHDHFERQGAVGRNIQIGEGLSNWYKVVGVVDDLEPRAFGGALGPRYAVYLSTLQHPPSAAQLLVRPRGAGSPPDVISTLSGIPGIRGGPTSAEESALVRSETAPIQWFGNVIGLEGWVVLMLAVASAFVLMHLWVLSVRHEIGVRRAVGATRVRILGFIVSRSLAVVAGGALFACWLGIMVWGSLSATITGLPEWDVSVLLGYLPLLGVAAVTGALVPALPVLRRPPARVLAGDLSS